LIDAVVQKNTETVVESLIVLFDLLSFSGSCVRWVSVAFLLTSLAEPCGLCFSFYRQLANIMHVISKLAEPSNWRGRGNIL